MVEHSSESSYIYTGSRAAVSLFGQRSAAVQAGFLLPYLKVGDRVVDCGCGTGEITVGLAEAVSPGEVVGIDRAESIIQQARKNAEKAGLTNMTVQVGDVTDLKLPDGSADVVYFHAVLAHLPDPEAALGEAHRVLKPGGTIAAREPEKGGDLFGGPLADSWYRFNDLLMADWRLAGGDPRLGGRLKGLLRGAGFEVIETTAIYDYSSVEGSESLTRFGVARLQEDAFVSRVVERGLADREALASMAADFDRYVDDPDVFAAIAEVEVLGRKA